MRRELENGTQLKNAYFNLPSSRESLPRLFTRFGETFSLNGILIRRRLSIHIKILISRIIQVQKPI